MQEGIQKWRLPILLLAISLICASTIQILIPGLKNVAIDDGVRRLEDVPFPFIRETSEPIKEYPRYRRDRLQLVSVLQSLSFCQLFA